MEAEKAHVTPPRRSWIESSNGVYWAVGVVVFAILSVYVNSIFGEFVFDDVPSIKDNATIRQLWPLGPVLTTQVQSTSTGRPLLNLSFALNYASGGLAVWGYHVVNIAIHTTNALLLFGILRRTFVLPMLRERFGDAAVALSLGIALLWAVHPLQTESVAYISQRAESLVGLFYLLTLYCVIRGAECGKSSGWYAGAVFACLLGMSAKEVMVTAPVVVLLYDRTFLAGSFRESLFRRVWLYVALALTWLFLAYLMASNGDLRRLYAGTGMAINIVQEGVGPWSYAATQTGVILRYLRLSFWPNPLVLDYDWPAATGFGEVLPAAIVVGILLAATLWGVIKRKPWGFLGGWFFLILSPTSSVVPLKDLIFEHRMYLPLAAVLTTVLLAGYVGCSSAVGRGWIGRPKMLSVGTGAVVMVAFMFGVLTIQRNKDYANQLSIWQDTAVKAPRNPRVHLNLGYAWAVNGQAEKAIEHYREALRLKPGYPQVNYNLAIALAATGRTEEAISRYRITLKAQPDFGEAHYNLGIALSLMGQTEEAIGRYQEALRLNPGYMAARFELANAQARKGHADEAILHYRAALRLNPDHAGAHNNLGVMLIGKGDFHGAQAQFDRALTIDPDYVDARTNLKKLNALAKPAK